ncbi:response regulator [Ramlibacter sp. AN1015]|uniref:hybrid sensor histidine kinase/response regulator n=1 Tax=Ramlibacter sp. AN1015 TaxID=3133428 RepID=UPI0030C12B1D
MEVVVGKREPLDQRERELRMILQALGALRRGDADASLPTEWEGLAGRVAAEFNELAAQTARGAHRLRALDTALLSGLEPKRLPEERLSGVWLGNVASVNLLVDQAQACSERTRAVLQALHKLRKGDAQARLPDDWPGAFGKLADAFNAVVDENLRMSRELARLSRVVGKEGKLKERALLPQAGGFWRESAESINSLIADLVHPTSEVARVLGAVAQGDLSKSMALEADGRPLQGEFLRTATTINRMVRQLGTFAAEVTRVAREVGTEGKLGGQAEVQGVAGTWKDLTDNVNFMASNLTSQVRNIADVTKAVAAGDLSKKITVDVKGEILELKNTINTMVDQLRSFASEVTRVAREVGTEGKLGGQADVQGVAGTWKDLTDSVNSMGSNLTAQVRNIAEVTTAVAAGDLSKKITVDVKGEILELKNTINTMVDQLRSFASEVTRVAREVGTEGKLGGQAEVQGVAGTWKDLTDNVNFMASNLTAQVRGIARVVTAVAGGDLDRKLTVEAKGEIAALADTINSMTDTLATFADQVTTVAREVGVEGKLGGQAKVPGAAGTWKNLTENVNQLAANLTTQVRAIAEVATAVTQGDLTRSVTVEALGEVAALKDTINEMIRNLRDTTQLNNEQDWLKTNLAKFTRMLQGQKDLVAVGQLILSELAPVVGVQQGEFYVLRRAPDQQAPRLCLTASYASQGHGAHGKEIALGEGLIGQCAVDRSKVLITSAVPENLRIASGLTELTPLNVLVLPIVFEGQVRGVVELASLERFKSTHLAFLDQLAESIGIVINTIAANMRTEDLLAQSQSLAQELQSRQQELQQTNLELQDKAKLLAHQNHEVEHKNREVEQARQALEEKAKQLALTSKYKSEFLANMSHELRTPLNSLLILSDQLSKNPEGNLSTRQVEFARTIHSSGNDLLMLINDILDLSKIESGTVAVEISELHLSDLQVYVERTFRHVADAKNVGFGVEPGIRLPETILTDAKRLQQILKNLLSNAFKFTHQGQVTLSIEEVVGGWSRDHEALNHAQSVIAFSVSDTGIGIATDKQQIIFEAFQQADGSTSRKYGGTGLGLAISRELSKLLGGEIRLASAPGQGSTFTLYLPAHFPSTRGSWRTASVSASREVAPQARHAPADRETPPATPAAVAASARRVAVAHVAADDTGDEATFGLPNEADDDRDTIAQGDAVLLIVENDLGFARFLLDAARAKGFKGLVTGLGAGALTLAGQHAPLAITLDMHLPDMDGWRVLDRLKQDLATRHVPVCVISTDESRDRAFNAGALGFVAKPVPSRDVLDALLEQLLSYAGRMQRKVLVGLDDEPTRRALLDLLADVEGLNAVLAEDTQQLLDALDEHRFDCVVLDQHCLGANQAHLREALQQVPGPGCGPVPLLLLRGAPGTPAWKDAPGMAAQVLPDAVALFDAALRAMHVATGKLPPATELTVREFAAASRPLAGRRVLIVDDDMRNIFALATVLEEHGMDIVWADSGREAINRVANDAHIDVVLMDIMMPEMDGMTTMKEIRRLPQGRRLPMIAVTAKAMKGDRERCIEAGAWDYLSKPVNTQDLLAVLRAWLPR